MTTLSDIAKKAGCSVNLVSYVLKKKEPITNEKHKRILQIAKELDYHTNFAARALVTGKMRNVTIVLNSLKGNLGEPFFVEFFASLSDCFEKAGMGIQLKTFDNDEKKIENMLLSGITDGFIWYFCDLSDKLVDILHRKNIPSISLMRKISGIPCIIIDDYKSSYNMLEYLYDLGHRDFAFCGDIYRNARFEAYNDFIAEKCLRSVAYFDINEWSQCSVSAVQRVLKKNGIGFTAVFCERDSYAIELMGLLDYFGIKVPERVSVVGYDDINKAKLCKPALTTVRQSYTDMAQLTVDRLMSLIQTNGEAEISDKTIVHDIIKRDSVKNLKISL